MVTSGTDLIEGRLRERSPSEFGSAQYQRVFEHTALTEVPKEGGDGLIQSARVAGMIFFDVFVAIPVNPR